MTSLFNNSVISQALAWTCGIGGIISNLYVMISCIRNYRYQDKTIIQISEVSRYNSTTLTDISIRKRTKMGKVAALFFANLSLADMLSCLYLTILACAEASSDSTSKTYLIYANESIRIYVNRTLVDYQLNLWKDSFLCQVLRFLNIAGTTASVWITLMIAIDRFVMIVYPLQFHRKFTLRRTTWACRIIWLYACICGSLTVILAQLTVLADDDSWYSRLCLIDNLDNDYVVAFAAYITVNNLLIYVTVSILMFYTLHCIRKSSIRPIKPRDTCYPVNFRQQRAETNLTITSVIVITNILCWLPTTMISLLFALGMTYIGTIPFALKGTVITLLYPANGFINPLVFIILNREMRFKR